MPPYVRQFGPITSVVLDQADFDAFVDELRGIFMVNADTGAGDEQLAAIKQARHLPLMHRGTKTEKFFARWGVTTDLLSAIVRGVGRDLVAQHPEIFAPEMLN